MILFHFDSSFVANASLVVNTSSFSVGNAELDAKQYENVAVVSQNETFNLSATIVDKKSKIKLANIQWGSFTWSAIVSLYTSVQCGGNGTLLTTSSSAIVVDTTAGTITATDLAITEIGMYIIKLDITSSNNQYSIPLTSNGILVKTNSSKF